MSNHPITHVEFSTIDRKASAKFYADVFGWQVQDYPEMNYTTLNSGEKTEIGLNPIGEDYPAGTVAVYIQTDDVAASLARVQAAGGIIQNPETEIPGVGWFGFFKDPSGNMVGLMKWKPQPPA